MFYLADAVLFALFALALLSLGLGALASQCSLLEILVLPALATLGALGLLIWSVGSLGFFNGNLWAMIFGVGWMIWMIWRRDLVKQNARRIWPALRALSATEKLLALYLLAVWALVFVLSLAPPNGADYDSLVYHLAVPAQYSHAGRIEQLPFDHHSYFPFTMEMLYGVALQLRGPVFAKLFHGLMLPLGAATLVAFGQRAQSRVGGLLAACLFTSLPMTLTEASTSYIDLAFAAFAAAAVLCFVGAPTNNRAHNLLWSGAFCGFCLGTKYFGWLIFGFLGIWLLVETLKTKPQNGGRGVLLFGLSALAIGGGWYARNWIWVGNPVYPFAYGVFGGRGWTAEMANLYNQSQAIYGFGRAPLDLIALPFRLAMTPLNVGGFEGLGVRGQPLWPLIPGPVGNADPNSVTGLFDVPGLFLVTFPGPAIFAFGLPALLCRNKPRPVLLVASLFVFLWIFWALTSQQVRYLFPALALLSVVAGWGMAHWAPRLTLARWIGGVGLAAWLLFAPMFTARNASGSFRVIRGAQTPTDYLTRTFPDYSAMQWINANTPATARVAVYGEPRDFYLNRSYFWADDGHNQIINYPKISTGAQLAAALKAQGATHVLANFAAARNGGVFGPPQPRFDEMVSSGAATLIFDNMRGYRVYQLK